LGACLFFSTMLNIVSLSALVAVGSYVNPPKERQYVPHTIEATL
jgi:hypothetical protein